MIDALAASGDQHDHNRPPPESGCRVESDIRTQTANHKLSFPCLRKGRKLRYPPAVVPHVISNVNPCFNSTAPPEPDPHRPGQSIYHRSWNFPDSAPCAGHVGSTQYWEATRDVLHPVRVEFALHQESELWSSIPAYPFHMLNDRHCKHSCDEAPGGGGRRSLIERSREGESKTILQI